MDRSERLLPFLVFLAIAVWHLVRLLRLGLGNPRPFCAIAVGPKIDELTRATRENWIWT
jgi:hypothetical protein